MTGVRGQGLILQSLLLTGATAFLTLPWAPLWQQAAAVGALSSDTALIKPTLSSPLFTEESFLPFTSSPSCFIQASPRPQSTEDTQQQPQHRTTQALKIRLSLMIQGSARHTDTQNWVEIQHLSGAADNLGGGARCWLETPEVESVPTSREASVPSISMETSLVLG